MRLSLVLVSLQLISQSPCLLAQSTKSLRGGEEASHGSLDRPASSSSPTAKNNAGAPLQQPTKVHHELATRVRNLQQDEDLKVIIGFRNTAGRDSILAKHQLRTSNFTYKEFASINAMATTISVAALNDLDLDENINYIEPDLIATCASQVVPFNVANIQGPPGYAGRMESTMEKTATTSGSCSDPSSFKIGIVDSGVDISHYDLPCRSRPENCVGQDFASTYDGDSWSTPLYAHGTHVMGTIGALGNNNLGIEGMIPDGNVCYLIGKALMSDGIGYVSDILSAIEWAAQNGANVINVSIVVSSYLQSTNQFFDDLYYNQNRLVVAAAGNNGATGEYLYPASYTSVISVASVDEDLQSSWFSQTNNRVDLVAFGRNIISTVPLTNAESLPLVVLTMEQDGSTLMGIYAKRSKMFDAPASGPIVQCPRKAATEACPGPGGHVCLIQRSNRQGYEGQARRCQAGLGIGIIVYQATTDQSFGGKLAFNTRVSIPVVAVDNATGQNLLSNYLGTSVTFETNNFGFGIKDGTSMATPAVTGAIGVIWRECRSCTNQQVEKCLKQTAQDLGPYGVDNAYGYGLVQLEPALTCLQSVESCC
ncbi:hypothetical protein MPSEU_001030800 [Mayamaea pseudoterrestris]|nr:hypothetical protein MPSEU_001030800 [Mayamaea pseudoterrestris]